MTLDIADINKNYFDTCVSLAFAKTNDEELSKDIAQETMIKVWLNLGDYNKSKGTLFTWINKIVKNTIIDNYRRTKDFSFIRDVNSPIWSNFTCPCHNIDTLDLEMNLNKIRIKYRFTLYQYYIVGFTKQQIADKFCMTLSEVKHNISQGLKALREIYS
ncbi:RNA polymerase sigma factor [Gaetbulibacter sp. PBL-D1]|uniref:RNA polymerase sigma factor n=1 Tax=Gaetbulibacter sp. PBL-D1 TaxID=3422594 RepID=UPI003D2EF556